MFDKMHSLLTTDLRKNLGIELHNDNKEFYNDGDHYYYARKLIRYKQQQKSNANNR